MLLWVVWVVAVAVALVVLGALLHGLLGAFQRLGRELDAAERDLRPVLEAARDSAEAAARLRAERVESG